MLQKEDKATIVWTMILCSILVVGAIYAAYLVGKNVMREPAKKVVELSEVLVTAKPEAEEIGNNIWRTDDHERGVSCYRSAQSGGTLSCVKVNP